MGWTLCRDKLVYRAYHDDVLVFYILVAYDREISFYFDRFSAFNEHNLPYCSKPHRMSPCSANGLVSSLQGF